MHGGRIHDHRIRTANDHEFRRWLADPDYDPVFDIRHRHGAKNGCGAHVALRARTPKEVDQFHAAGLKAGAKDNGAPGLRTDYAPNYYAAFLLDADGNNVEAVCMR